MIFKRNSLILGGFLAFNLVSCVTTSNVTSDDNLQLEKIENNTVEVPGTRNFETVEKKMNKASEIKIIEKADFALPK